MQGLADPDDVPDAPNEPIVVAGEIWQLGDHRLICGDNQISWGIIG